LLEPSAVFLVFSEIIVLLEEFKLFNQISHPLFHVRVLLSELDEGNFYFIRNESESFSSIIFILYIVFANECREYL